MLLLLMKSLYVIFGISFQSVQVVSSLIVKLILYYPLHLSYILHLQLEVLVFVYHTVVFPVAIKNCSLSSQIQTALHNAVSNILLFYLVSLLIPPSCFVFVALFDTAYQFGIIYNNPFKK